MDCNDTDSDINPDADEVCDGIDNDCDGDLDDADDSLTGGLNTYYLDSDGDGYGDINTPFESCSIDTGYVDNSEDCDDGNSSTYPGAAQLDSTTACMSDADGDGYGAGLSGSCTYTIDMVDSYGDGWNNASLDLSINGQAVESYTLASGASGSETFSVNGGDTWSLSFQSGSWDSEITFTVSDSSGTILWDMSSAPIQGDSYSDTCSGSGVSYTAGTDCDDNNVNVYPGASDAAYDGIDADCAGDSDFDADGDGYDDVSAGGEDCDDSDAGINPGATEIYYDNIDQDCANDSDFDADGDGYDDISGGGEDCDDSNANVNPMAAEDINDGIDNNCDGQIDEAFATYSLGESTLSFGQPLGIAVDNDDTIHLIWRDSNALQMNHISRSADGSWGEVSELTTADATGDFLDVAVDGIDRLQLTYSASNGSATFMDYRYYDIYNDTWSTPIMVDQISSSTSIIADFRLAIDVDNANLPSIAYYNQVDQQPVLIEIDSPITNSLSNLTGDWIDLDSFVDPIGLGYYTGTFIDFAIDQTGTSHVVWYNDVIDSENQYNAVSNGNNDGECTDFWGTSDSYVESASNGIHNAVAVKSNNTPCVAYIDESSNDVMYACNTNSDPCDQGWSVETVSNGLSGTAYTNLAFNSLDEPYISYYDFSSGDLKLAHNPGTGWVIQSIDTIGNVGDFNRLAIDDNDQIHIIYYDATNNEIRYATGQ